MLLGSCCREPEVQGRWGVAEPLRSPSPIIDLAPSIDNGTKSARRLHSNLRVFNRNLPTTEVSFDSLASS